MFRTHRRLSLTAASLLLVALVGCSSPSPDVGSAGDAGSAPGDGFPVTVEHKLGEATVNAAPERVASVGIGDTDVLLALGIQPVLAAVWPGSTTTGVGEWAEPLLTGEAPTPLLNGTTEFSVEAVAASDPDLIVAVNNAIDETRYAQLSSIAPTVLHAGDETDWVLPWQSLTTRVGTAVGKEDEAEQLVSDTEALMTKTAEENRDLAGKTAALLVVFDDGQVSVFSEKAARGQILASLGLVLPDELKSDDNALRLDISPENLSVLDSVDILVIDNFEKDRARLVSMPTFNNLDVVKNGNVVALDAVTSDAVSMPNPVTIPFVLDRLVEEIRKTPAGSAG